MDPKVVDCDMHACMMFSELFAFNLVSQVLRMGTRIEKLEKKSLVALEKDRFDTKQEVSINQRPDCVDVRYKVRYTR